MDAATANNQEPISLYFTYTLCYAKHHNTRMTEPGQNKIKQSVLPQHLQNSLFRGEDVNQ